MHLAVACPARGGLSGGFRKYLQSVVPLLRADPRLRRVDVFIPPAAAAELAAEGLRDLRTWEEGDHRTGFRRLRSEISALAPDVLFVPSAHYLDCGRPCVVMIRNMEPLEQPLSVRAVRAGLVNVGRALAARRACRRAARVIAVSDHVARFLTDRWRLKPDRVAVVYHGVDPPALVGEASRPATARGLAPGGFLFTAGSIRPARGLEDALDALGLLGERGPALLVGGRADADTHSYFRSLQARASRLKPSGRVVWAGQLGRSEMDWCYSNCAAFLMTSRAEACPNTLLEAMSHGCLVVSTDKPPMPELIGGAALLYRARDGSDLARQVSTALTADPGARNPLRAAARARAAEFTWPSTERQTVDQLQKALG